MNACLENRACIYLKGNRIFLNIHIVRIFKFLLFVLDDKNQLSRGVLKKKCSENMQQVYTENTHAEVRFQ